MSTLLLWLNLFASSFAVAANVWAATTGPARTRPLCAAVAVLAGVYAGFYLADLAGLVPADVRTAVAQGVSPVAFIVAWGAPALAVGRSYRHTLIDLRRLADRLPPACDDKATMPHVHH